MYNIENPWIIELIRTIVNRGHEIGYHAGYDTYLDEELTKKEVHLLRTILEKNNIKTTINGGRQHYLRWRTPDTFRNWEAAGMKYDSTLGFADMPGFRCGIC